MKRIYKTLAIIGATAALVSCGGNKTKTAETETVDEVNRISVAEAVMQDVPQSEVYSSTVEAFAVNNIAPQTGGRIDNIKVDVGDFVSKGQILAIMDAAQLDQTRMKLQNDSTELGRLNSLYRQGGVSKSVTTLAREHTTICSRTLCYALLLTAWCLQGITIKATCILASLFT